MRICWQRYLNTIMFYFLKSLTLFRLQGFSSDAKSEGTSIFVQLPLSATAKVHNDDALFSNKNKETLWLEIWVLSLVLTTSKEQWLQIQEKPWWSTAVAWPIERLVNLHKVSFCVALHYLFLFSHNGPNTLDNIYLHHFTPEIMSFLGYFDIFPGKQKQKLTK